MTALHPVKCQVLHPGCSHHPGSQRPNGPGRWAYMGSNNWALPFLQKTVLCCLDPQGWCRTPAQAGSAEESITVLQQPRVRCGPRSPCRVGGSRLPHQPSHTNGPPSPWQEAPLSWLNPCSELPSGVFPGCLFHGRAWGPRGAESDPHLCGHSVGEVIPERTGGGGVAGLACSLWTLGSPCPWYPPLGRRA